MPPIEVLKLITDGGSAVAVIVVVVLFLNAQSKSQQLVRTIADDFMKEIASVRTLFLDQVGLLSRSHSDLSRETIRAVDRLEAAVARFSSDRHPLRFDERKTTAL